MVWEREDWSGGGWESVVVEWFGSENGLEEAGHLVVVDGLGARTGLEEAGHLVVVEWVGSERTGLEEAGHLVVAERAGLDGWRRLDGEDGHLTVAELSPEEWLIVVGSEFSFAEHTFFLPVFPTSEPKFSFSTHSSSKQNINQQLRQSNVNSVQVSADTRKVTRNTILQVYNTPALLFKSKTVSTIVLLHPQCHATTPNPTKNS